MTDERVIRVRDDRRSLNYGEARTDREAWSLFVGTQDGERLELLLGEAAMYELWTEVQGRPWPDATHQTEEIRTLRREIVERANGMDEEGLRATLDAIEAIQRGESP